MNCYILNFIFVDQNVLSNSCLSDTSFEVPTLLFFNCNRNWDTWSYDSLMVAISATWPHFLWSTIYSQICGFHSAICAYIHYMILFNDLEFSSFLASYMWCGCVGLCGSVCSWELRCAPGALPLSHDVGEWAGLCPMHIGATPPTSDTWRQFMWRHHTTLWFRNWRLSHEGVIGAKCLGDNAAQVLVPPLIANNGYCRC